MTNRQIQEEKKASGAYYCGIAVKYFLMHINWQTTESRLQAEQFEQLAI